MAKTPEQEMRELLLLLQHSRSERLDRPFIIEVTGTPDSGKTSVINALTRMFKRFGWRVNNPTEGAEIIKKVPRTTYLYNIRTATYALAVLLDDVHSLDFDMVIFDRALYDAICWMDYWHDKGQIPESLARSNQRYFSQPNLINLIDVGFFVVCEAQEALAREDKWALTDIQGETTNPATIEKLYRLWTSRYQDLKSRKYPVVLLDTTKVTPQEMGRNILAEVLAAMRRRFNRKT